MVMTEPGFLIQRPGQRCEPGEGHKDRVMSRAGRHRGKRVGTDTFQHINDGQCRGCEGCYVRKTGLFLDIEIYHLISKGNVGVWKGCVCCVCCVYVVCVFAYEAVLYIWCVVYVLYVLCVYVLCMSVCCV